LSETTFGGVNPIFRVRDLAASREYYVSKLGFKVDWEAPPVVCVSNGRCAIFLCDGDQGNPGAWVWVGVGDVEVLHEELKLKDAKIRHAPTNYAWALEMQVEDLDGNILRIGSEPRKNEPIGEWLDMYGVVWKRNAAGEWERSS
jgi:catechol 2,3-dioxygenase-like lactoylglutathione lyase family enzyme